MNICKSAALAAAIGLISGYTVSADELRVGMDPTFAPFEFVDENGELTGFDVELIRYVANAAGFDGVDFKNVPFDNLISSLNTSQIDLVISAVAITRERRTRIDFTTPYVATNLSLIVLDDQDSKITRPEDLQNSRICVETGSTSYNQARKVSEYLVEFKVANEGLEMLRAGKCDALLNDQEVNNGLMKTKNKGDLRELSDFFPPELVGMAVRKGNQILLERINRAIQEAQDRGVLESLHRKWFEGTTSDPEFVDSK